MAKKRRDYKAEYQRRIRRAAQRGQSRAQARGHPRPGEKHASTKAQQFPIEDSRLQLGLKLLRQGRPLTKVAKEIHVSPERLRNYGGQNKVIEKRGRRWVLRGDLARKVLIYSAGRELPVTVGDFETASLVGRYMAHVRWFLESNNRAHLKPFVGKSVKDINGKSYPLETNPNTLYRLAHGSETSFEQIYRIVV